MAEVEAHAPRDVRQGERRGDRRHGGTTGGTATHAGDEVPAAALDELERADDVPRGAPKHEAAVPRGVAHRLRRAVERRDDERRVLALCRARAAARRAPPRRSARRSSCPSTCPCGPRARTASRPSRRVSRPRDHAPGAPRRRSRDRRRGRRRSAARSYGRSERGPASSSCSPPGCARSRVPWAPWTQATTAGPPRRPGWSPTAAAPPTRTGDQPVTRPRRVRSATTSSSGRAAQTIVSAPSTASFAENSLVHGAISSVARTRPTLRTPGARAGSPGSSAGR